MTYIPEEATVIYKSKDGKEKKIFDALEWLAARCSHVPNRGSKWSDTMAIIVMYQAENGKSRIRAA